MARNGSGTFVRAHDFTDDAAAAIKIRADRMDEEIDGIATALSASIANDGQTTVLADLPMGGFKHTGVGNATARNQYATVASLQDGSHNWVAAGGTADAITATYAPALTALVDGQLCFVRAGAANATTTPTFAPNGLTAHTMTKFGGSALAPSDIAGAGHDLILRYKLASTIWELLNPANSSFLDSAFRIKDNGDATKQIAFEASGISTGTTRTITVPNANITLARIDGAQTLAGTQSFSGSILTDTLTNYTSGNRVVVQAVGVAAGGVIMDFRGSDTGFTASICDMDAGGANNAGTAFQIQKVNSTSRSISAAGTINASGADYAEYETKADGCGAVAKGQIVGFDADGKLTDKFSAAISFGIKSTDPSYVGGDVWGNEEALGIAKPQAPAGTASQIRNINSTGRSIEVAGTINATAEDFAEAETQAVVAAYEEAKASFEAALEEARSKVDRIAYSGKVPVNVIGAHPGDYIVVTAGDGDTILGRVVSGGLSFSEYLKAVGRVRRILGDGRAMVSVIVH